MFFLYERVKAHAFVTESDFLCWHVELALAMLFVLIQQKLVLVFLGICINYKQANFKKKGFKSLLRNMTTKRNH